MRLTTCLQLLFVAATSKSSFAFAPYATKFSGAAASSTVAMASSTSSCSSSTRSTSTKDRCESAKNLFTQVGATAALSLALWGGPAALTSTLQQQQQEQMSTNFGGLPSVVERMFSANAKEKASGSGSRVNKDAESLLRYGLPIQNKEVRELQKTIETIKYDIGSKRKTAALEGAKKSKFILTSKKADKMIESCRDAKVCQSTIDKMIKGTEPLLAALGESQDAFRGSEQEDIAQDDAYDSQKALTKLLNVLEEQMIPKGYTTPVPDEYSDLPQLKKRATVEMVLNKANPGDVFDVKGVNIKTAKLVMVVDGYAAPVTAGNFVDLVSKGFYNNMKIQRSDGFVVQTGDPDGDAIGYVGTPSKSIGAGPNGERQIPCEIFVKGDKGPFYESTMEDEGRGGEATVLPFSSYGAMGWARDEYDPNSGSSQFFWLLFDSDLTPAGKNVLDGRYPCFGYVVEGADSLSAVEEGDIIVSAKVTDGMQYLVQPK